MKLNVVMVDKWTDNETIFMARIIYYSHTKIITKVVVNHNNDNFCSSNDYNNINNDIRELKRIYIAQKL